MHAKRIFRIHWEKSSLNLRKSQYPKVLQSRITIFCITFQMTKGETSPPPLLTEADLIALMEKHGIGGNHSSSLERTILRHFTFISKTVITFLALPRFCL